MFASRRVTTKAAAERFFKAIRARDLAVVASLLDGEPALIACTRAAPPKKDDGQSPLQVALKAGAFDVARLLVDRGADVNFIETSAVNEWRAPVVHDCVRASMMCSDADAATALSMLRLLLARGADANAIDSYGNSVLHRAILDAKQMTHLPNRAPRTRPVFYALLDAGADAFVADKRREPPDRDARGTEVYRYLVEARTRTTKTATPLLERIWDHAPIEAVDDAVDVDGRTPLFHAVACDHRGAIAALLDGGANVNAADAAGWSALGLARWSLPLSELLLRRGADPNQRDRDGFTPFSRTFYNKELAELMLAHGADPMTKNTGGKTYAEVSAR